VQVLEQCPTAEAALRLQRVCPTDLWLVAALLPGVSGFELVRRLCARGIAEPALIVSQTAGNWALARAVRAGARGFLSEPFEADLFSKALDHLQAGRTYRAQPGRSSLEEAISTAGVDALTPSQFEVLHLLLQHAGPSETARAMSISRRSAAAYRRLLRRALGDDDPARLERLAILLGPAFYPPRLTADD